MTYPFAGEIKMTKVIKDGEEVIEWEQVDMSASPTGNTYFFGTTGNATEVLRLSREGIWANPDVPVDEAAKLVLEALDSQIKVLVQKAVEAECARLAQPEPDYSKAGFGKSQNEEGCAECGKQSLDGWALYCVKCSEREWQGLTDEEILDVLHPLVMADMSDEATDYEIARAIESKLREKNT